MKKRVLLIIPTILIGYAALTSATSGAASVYGYNRTGSKANITNCGGAGCHGGTSVNTTVSITVDSGTLAVSNYKPGKTYTIRIHGTNSSSLSGFGFQFSAVSGTGSTQVNAGSFGTMPSRLHTQTISGITIVEQSSLLLATTAGKYDTSFTWTAPAAGTGTVTMYATLNAVNGDGNATSVDVSNNSNIQLGELSSVAVTNVFDNMSLNIYPNPVVNNLHLQMNQAVQGKYSISVFDINGKILAHTEAQVNSANYEMSINTSNWSNGLYLVQITNGDAVKTLKVIK